MSHIIELTDEQYETLRQAADERGETIEALIAALIREMHDHQASAHAFTTDDWFHHLGATDEQITEAKRLAQERSDADA